MLSAGEACRAFASITCRSLSIAYAADEAKVARYKLKSGFYIAGAFRLQRSTGFSLMSTLEMIGKCLSTDRQVFLFYRDINEVLPSSTVVMLPAFAL